MQQNIGPIDKYVRIGAGALLVVLATFSAIGPWGFIGLLPLATGLMGSCPAYSLLGMNTCPAGAAAPQPAAVAESAPAAAQPEETPPAAAPEVVAETVQPTEAVAEPAAETAESTASSEAPQVEENPATDAAAEAPEAPPADAEPATAAVAETGGETEQNPSA